MVRLAYNEDDDQYYVSIYVLYNSIFFCKDLAIEGSFLTFSYYYKYVIIIIIIAGYEVGIQKEVNEAVWILT